MKKIYLIFILSLPIFGKEYTIYELLKLYENNSYIAQINQINKEKSDITISEFEKNRWKKLNLEINPIKLNGSKGQGFSKNLQVNYNGFYYNIIKDDKNKKSEEKWGYTNSIYNALFKTHFERNDIILNNKLNDLNNKKNLVAGEKEFIELVYKYKLSVESVKKIEFDKKELLEEKEILENKMKINEVSKYDVENNYNEIESLKNLLDKNLIEKSLLLKKISDILKITLENNTEISDITISNDIKESIFDLEINKLNIKILNNKKEIENLSILRNINLTVENDDIKTGSSFSVEITWTPFTDKLNEELIKYNLKNMEIEKNKIEKEIELEYQSNLNNFEFLKREYERIYNHYIICKEKYEIIRVKFENGIISYSDFLKVKKEFFEKKEESLKIKLELEKFWIKESLLL